ncbi:protein phosphatase PTC7 homolog isoform X2 [Leptinotarsa decemlineata]|uniref:protein phosphatase PTC7 homolog isoform X2 n=1 Tax=Leptinotarsa decemlineata TaxID=7539 RepID=UPI003D307AFA
MHSLLITGRLLSRALWNGITNVSTATDPSRQRKTEPQLVSAVCGFSKRRKIQRLIKGQFGDDAWFTAKYKTADVLGSSTACVVILNKENSTLYTANIGDSGVMVVRRGKVIHKSEEQQHYFNTPFQLSLPPPGYQQEVLSDQPDSAITDNFPVEDGDVILVATDGVFDNLPQSLILNELVKVQGERCATRLQMVANSIAWMARNLSFDETFLSPFSVNAFANGIDTIGGKPDDITVVLATVAI